jgi:hypothetical protein
MPFRPLASHDNGNIQFGLHEALCSVNHVFCHQNSSFRAHIHMIRNADASNLQEKSGLRHKTKRMNKKFD